MKALLKTYRTSINPITNGLVCYLHSLEQLQHKYECTAKEILCIAESTGRAYNGNVTSLAHRVRGVCVTLKSLAKSNSDVNGLRAFLDMGFEFDSTPIVPSKGRMYITSETPSTKLKNSRTLMEENERLIKANRRLVLREKRLRQKLTQAQRTNVANVKEVNLLRMALNIRPSDSQTTFYKKKVDMLYKSLDQQVQTDMKVLKVLERRHDLKTAVMSKEIKDLREKLHKATLRRIELLEIGSNIDMSANVWTVSNRKTSDYKIENLNLTPETNTRSDPIPENLILTSGTNTHSDPISESTFTSSIDTGTNSVNIPPLNTDIQVCTTTFSSSENFDPPTFYGDNLQFSDVQVKIENAEDELDIKIDPLDDYEYEAALQSGVATTSNDWDVSIPSKSANAPVKLLAPDEIKKEKDLVTFEEMDSNQNPQTSSVTNPPDYLGVPDNVVEKTILTEKTATERYLPVKITKTVTQNTLSLLKTKVTNFKAPKGKPRTVRSILKSYSSKQFPTINEGQTFNARSLSNATESNNIVTPLQPHTKDLGDPQSSSIKLEPTDQTNSPRPVAVYSAQSCKAATQTSDHTTVKIKTKRKLENDDSVYLGIKKPTVKSSPKIRFISVPKNVSGKHFELKEPEDCRVESTRPKWGEYPRVKNPKNIQSHCFPSTTTIHDVRRLPEVVKTDHSYCAMVILEMHPC